MIVMIVREISANVAMGTTCVVGAVGAMSAMGAMITMRAMNRINVWILLFRNVSLILHSCYPDCVISSDFPLISLWCVNICSC